MLKKIQVIKDCTVSPVLMNKLEEGGTPSL